MNAMPSSSLNATDRPLHSEFFNEMFDGSGAVRAHYRNVHAHFTSMGADELKQQQNSINHRMLEEGITFTLYKPDQTEPLERTIPFDMIPRVISHAEWTALEAGLKQRVRALNAFIADLYKDQHIIRDGLIPRKAVVSNCYFRHEMMNLPVPNDTYIHASGIDLIRDEQGHYMVLEDNLRSPSGFSYLFQCRSMMTQSYPDLYFSHAVSDVDRSISHFLSALKSLAPKNKKNPVIALLTPGSFNSAYYEHAFLAQELGIELLEGNDLVCSDHKIYMKGLSGYTQVDVIYRRIDDDFLDPLAFRPDSVLGVAGLMNAYRAGHVAIANAPGTGVADDKAIYTYVPDMIRYYLNEQPLLANVPTYYLGRPDEREYVLERLDKMVVKETSLSGGYGMLIGPTADEAELALFADKIRSNPDNYIAQPTIKLSTAPVLSGGQMTHRHIDLRAFVFMDGKEANVVPGGLTRVAMKEGSLVVNSSQGGGCKDTWVLNK